MVSERKLLRRIFGRTKERDGTWRIKTNDELDELIRHKNRINRIKAQRLSWFGHLHRMPEERMINPLNPELNPICCLLALLGANHFLHVSRIRVKLLTFRLLMPYIYGAPILDVSRSHTTQHSQ